MQMIALVAFLCVLQLGSWGWLHMWMRKREAEEWEEELQRREKTQVSVVDGAGRAVTDATTYLKSLMGWEDDTDEAKTKKEAEAGRRESSTLHRMY